MTAGAGLLQQDSSGLVLRIIKEILDSMIFQCDALLQSLPPALSDDQSFVKREDLTHRISSLEKIAISPGGCGCEGGKSGTVPPLSPGMPLGVNPLSPEPTSILSGGR